MSLSDLDKREVCVLHGWVGHRVFHRDRHDLCEAPADQLSEESDELGDNDVDSLAEDDGDESAEVSDPDDPDDLDNADDDKDDDARWSRTSARSRGIPPKKTLAIRRITRVDLEAGRAELKALGADKPYDRPKTRGDCANVPRPCPYIACSHSLYLDVSETGSIILNFPHLEPGQMPADRSCSLDLAERGPMTLEEIAVVTNLTRERIRQVELKALIRRAKPAAIALGLSVEDAAAIGTRHHVGPGADLEETGVEGAVPSDVASLLVGGEGEGKGKKGR
jgi:hypothetical protein